MTTIYIEPWRSYPHLFIWTSKAKGEWCVCSSWDEDGNFFSVRHYSNVHGWSVEYLIGA